MDTDKKTIVVAPILAAILLYIAYRLWLWPIFEEDRFNSLWIFNVAIHLVLRIAIGIWTVSLTRDYKLHQTLWVILGLVFGLPQLIAINFAIWFRPLFKKEENQ